MRRVLPVLLLVAAVVAVVLLVSGGGSSDDGYKVRAIFDNGGFMVTGEEVRVAGATVGSIESVGVTLPGDAVAYKGDEAVEKPGKAVIVMDIEDPGFQDFRSDATCQIRPQSLIGEKFVDCRTTMPRAPGSEAPPALKEIPDGEPGAGQHLLPLGNNGTSVDPDLINDIQTLPYAQRFRLIFNELGAGLAGRGGDLEVLVKRANPVLRDVDTLFGVLAEQRNELAQLASDSDAILTPLARERAHVAGFIDNAGIAAEASSERGPELEEALSKFPTFLREFRTTMARLEGFSDAATPVFEELGTAAPSLTDATRTLTPFSQATTVALKSLGAAGEASGPIFQRAEPIVRKTRDLARSGVVPTNELAKLTTNLQATKGWDHLVRLIYNSAGSSNGFDQYGHFGRVWVAPVDCAEYQANAGGKSGCVSRFNGIGAAEAADSSSAEITRLYLEQIEKENGATAAPGSAAGGPTTGLGRSEAREGEAGLGESSAAKAGAAARVSPTEGTEPLLDYLLGP